MKKILFLVLLSTTTYASVSFLGGLNYGRYLIDSTGSSPRIAPSGGMGMDWMVSRQVSVGLEALFLQRKSHSSGADVTLNNVAVPVLFKFWPSTFFSLNLGPYVAYGIGKVKSKTETAESENTYSDSNLKELDYGIVVGASLNFGLGKSVSFFIESHYGIGMADVSKSSLAKIKYNDMLLLGGLKFGGASK